MPTTDGRSSLVFNRRRRASIHYVFVKDGPRCEAASFPRLDPAVVAARPVAEVHDTADGCPDQRLFQNAFGLHIQSGRAKTKVRMSSFCRVLVQIAGVRYIYRDCRSLIGAVSVLNTILVYM